MAGITDHVGRNSRRSSTTTDVGRFVDPLHRLAAALERAVPFGPSPDHREALPPGLRAEWFPFGYEYESLYPGVSRLFKVDRRVVLEADRDGSFFLVEDFGACADYDDPDFGDVMHEQVRIIEFATVDEREAYLRDRYGVPPR